MTDRHSCSLDAVRLQAQICSYCQSKMLIFLKTDATQEALKGGYVGDGEFYNSERFERERRKETCKEAGGDK